MAPIAATEKSETARWIRMTSWTKRVSVLPACARMLTLERSLDLEYSWTMTSAEHQELVEFLGRQFAEIDRRFTEVDRRFIEVGRRFDEMGGEIAEVKDHVAELRREMLGHFDEIYRLFERLEQEYHAITQALRRIEAALADEQGRREIIERDLAVLKNHVTTLQSRIEEIERRLGH
jgi:chromosome segregation ATPase